MSNRKICKLIDVDLPDQLVKKSAIKLIQKLKIMKKPNSLMNLLRIDRNPRMNTNLQLKNGFRTKRGKRSFLNKALKLYNSIPSTLKNLPMNLFKKRLLVTRIEEVPDDWWSSHILHQTPQSNKDITDIFIFTRAQLISKWTLMSLSLGLLKCISSGKS